MKINPFFRYLVWSTVLVSFSAIGYAQVEASSQSKTEVSSQERAKLRAAIEANPNNMEAHKAYLETFASADDAKSQYDLWMKKFPKSAAIPLAIADKYGSYSPRTAEYLLKVAELDPKNIDVWQKLALDASMRGDKEKQQQYLKNAIVADPQDLGASMSYVFSFKNDKARYKEKAFEFVEKHPSSDEAAMVLHLYGYDLKDNKEKIAVWEQLRSMFPLKKVQVAMSRLADVYIQTGQDDKAIQLAESLVSKAQARLGFPRKLELAQTLVEIEKKMEEGKYAEAKDLIMLLDVRPTHLFEIGSRVALVKAAVLNATGSVKAAYDSLLVFQAKTPDIAVEDALALYGNKLGKNPEQIKHDLRSVIYENAKPAPAFELESYTSDGNVSLEDLKGKVVLLSFWYPGCGPCRAEMPHIEAAIQDIDRDKLVYLGVNGDRGQDDFVRPFMNGTQYSFTPLAGTKAMTDAYEVQYYPTNYIIDQDGNIVYSRFMITPVNEKMLELMIQSLL